MHVEEADQQLAIIQVRRSVHVERVEQHHAELAAIAKVRLPVVQRDAPVAVDVHGVRRFRVELVRETQPETARVLAAYRDLLTGRVAPDETVARVGANAHFGVSSTPMEVMR